jgi:UDP-3-O-[3-hydroxymyristoyl] glucosamine N-acyltransferase
VLPPKNRSSKSECERYEPGHGSWRRIPGIGGVTVEDDVSVGPLTVVEKGFRENTVIGARSIVGGQVYISHDCHIGAGYLLIGQTGLASGVVVGDEASLMGRGGVNSEVRIGAGAVVFAGNGVFGDVAPHDQVLGYPARSRRQALKAMALPRHVEALERRLAEIEKQPCGKPNLAAPLPRKKPLRK